MKSRLTVSLALGCGASFLLGSALPSCSSDPCDDGLLAQNPAFVLPLDGAAVDGECSVYGYTLSDSGGEQRMYCHAPVEDRCDCYGGGVPDDYRVLMYSVETNELVDEATVQVSRAPSPRCRDLEVTSGFTGALKDTFFGAGGEGGGGGAGGGGAAGESGSPGGASTD